MKEENFDYEKYGNKLLGFVFQHKDEWHVKKINGHYWSVLSVFLNNLDIWAYCRTAIQWRRIYYTARRKAGLVEKQPIKFGRVADPMSSYKKPIVEYSSVDTADQLSEVNEKLDKIMDILKSIKPGWNTVIL
jgi:hypothetical protein